MKMLYRSLLLLTFIATTSGLFAQKLKAVDNTQNAGKVEWVTRQVDAGKSEPGTPVTGEFEVKNISKENLIIMEVRSSCHCTAVEWTREPIAPGKSGIIKAIYDGQREGEFYRIITVTTNFDPAQSIPLALIGKVEARQDTAKN